MSSKRKNGNRKKWRQGVNGKRERNWTDLETDAFCEILADGEYSFSITLETKALKKQANREVFEEIQRQLKTAILDPDFIEENKKFFEDAQLKNFNISVEKLRNNLSTNLHIANLTSPNVNLARPIVDVTDHRPNSQ